MITFKDKAVLCITKLTGDPSFEEKLLSLFRAEGLYPEVYGSEKYED